MKHRRIAATWLLIGVTATAVPGLAQSQRPAFRSSRDIVSIDVVVRDRDGNVVRGLTAADFEIRENGRPQELLNFAFQEISESPGPAADPVNVLAEAETRMNAPAAAAQVAAAPVAMTADALAGRRLMVLLFDVSSMAPEDVQRAVDSAREFVRNRMSPADLVAVATIGTTLDVLTDFTGERTRVETALGTLAFSDGLATEAPAASTVATDEAAAEAAEETGAEASELDMFNNDVRLRALRTLAETLPPIEQKKAILYFSAGIQRSGQDNLVELRDAINTAVRAHVAIYPVDVRGLQAVVPGGDASRASGRGQSLFSGRGLAQQFSRLAASQDTLVSLAEDSGGRAFIDTNDFGEAFARVQRDLSAYYLLGYSSTDTARDGRFRRVQVRVRRDGLRVEARAGYFAERDFTHTSRSDRELQLQEQLAAAVSATDLPVLVTGGFFRLSPDRYYVPISVAVPGSAVPVPPGRESVSLDVLGMVRDEQGRPVGRIRQTMEVGTKEPLSGKQVLYESGVTLPPGRFSVKVVVRENADGTIGSFEAPVIVPDLKQAPVKVSSVVLSTQLQPVTGRVLRENPLVRDGLQLVPNVTHVVGHDQKLFFYFEVYEPVVDGSGAALRASLAFYRGKVKVLETPAIERTGVDAADRRAAIFRLEVPAGRFKPGLYTCQVNIIDAAAGRFAFPRLALLVK